MGKAEVTRLYVTAAGARAGEDHPMAKLTWSEVELMRQCHEAGLSMRAIAEKFERPWSTVRDACQYITWGELPTRPARTARRLARCL